MPSARRQGAEFEKFGSLDPKNVTLLSLVRCRADDARNRYLLVKVPKLGLEERFGQADLKQLAHIVEQPDFATTMEAIPKEVGVDKTAKTGVPTEVRGHYKPRGHDSVCVYLGGSLSTIKSGRGQKQAGGTCMTIAGNRLIALNAYENSEDPLAYRHLLPVLRQWALSIRALRQ